MLYEDYDWSATGAARVFPRQGVFKSGTKPAGLHHHTPAPHLKRERASDAKGRSRTSIPLPAACHNAR